MSLPSTVLGPAPDRPVPRPQRRDALTFVLPRLLGVWLVALAAVTGLGLVLTRWAVHTWPLTAEDGVNRWFAARRTAGRTDLSTLGSGFGNTSTIVVVTLLAVVVLWRVLRRRLDAVFIAACVTGQALVFLGASRMIGRARPAVDHVDHSLPTSSFPSGHTSAALALYCGLALLVHRGVTRAWSRRLAVVGLLLLPALVGVSRLYRGMHHPSDLLGALVNSGLVLILTALVLQSFRSAFATTHDTDSVTSAGEDVR
jgi:undecaprenyl-diphosphatase